MTSNEAKKLRIDHDACARMLNRMTVANLRIVHARNLSAHGREILFGGPQSKDELISAILELSGFGIAKLNEAIHVLAHDGWKNEICEFCQEA